MSDVKRLKYYDHQFLHVQDFADEQKYHLDMRRLHNQHLHTYGIVQGLQVTVASGGTGTAVSVSAGIAMDSKGQEMVLPQDTNLELGGETAGTAVYITIAYAEQESDRSTEADVTGNTRITESPTLSFSKDAPTDKSMTLILAKVPRTSTGLGPVDLSDRKQAGVVLGSDLTLNTLTLKKDGVAQANWPVWTCGGANQAALANAGLYVNGNVGIGTANPARSLQVNQGTTTAFSISDRLFLDGSSGTVRITNNAYVDSSGSWAIADASAKASTVEIRNTGIVDIYGTRTAGKADWQQMASFDAGKNQVLFPNGNVGIGTQTPQSTLDVAGTAHFIINYNAKFPTYGSTMGAGGLAIGWNGQSDSRGATEFVNFPGGGSGGFNFVLADNKGNVSTTPMVIAGSGNVGIGTTAPRSRLQVAGGDVTVPDGLLHVGGSATPTTNSQGAYLGWNSLTGGTGETDFINNQGGGSGGFAFMNTPASGNPKTTLMFITGTGNVGIGTTSPTRQLEIHQGTPTSFSISDRLFLDGSPGDTVRITNNAYIDSSRNWAIADASAKASTIEIRNSGVVDIFGTVTAGKADWRRMASFDAPNNQVLIEGTLFVRGPLNYFWGPDNQWKNIQNRASDFAGSYTTGAPASDLRLKQEVQLLPSALEKTRKLRGVSFRWNAVALRYFTRDIETAFSAGPHATDEENQNLWQAERDKSYKELSQTNIGVIAQEVEDVLPEAVTTDEAGYKTVQYRDLIPLLIEAVKEQDAIVAAQAERMGEQQAEIDRLIAAQRAMQVALKELAAVKAQVAQLAAVMQHTNATPVHLAPEAEARCSAA